MKKLNNLIQLLSLFFITFLLICASLAIFGIFYKGLILLFALFALIIFCIIVLSKKNFKFSLPVSFISTLPLLLIFVISLFHTSFHHDFSLGRDETGYQVAAIQLSKTSKLYFQDIFTRPFHPFREVDDMPLDTFTSQFMPGYNSYLAVWHIFLGLKGMLISNLPLIFITLFSLYQISQILFKSIKPKYFLQNQTNKTFLARLTPLLFIISFYSYFWFFRRTNAENLFMACFWLGSWLFLDGIIKKKIWQITSGIIPFSFLILIRGEGILYLIIYFALSLTIVIFSKIRNKSKTLYPYLAFLIPILIMIAHQFYSDKLGGSYLGDHLYALQRTILNNFFKNPQIAFLIFGLLIFGSLISFVFYLILKKKISILKITSALGILTIIVTHWILHYYFLNSEREFHWVAIRTSYVFNVFSGYLLLCFLIMLALGLLSSIDLKNNANKLSSLSLLSTINLFKKFLRIFKKPQKNILLLLFILVLPSFIFLFDPFVALDQPWFMRRFYPIFLPFIFILSGIFIYNFPLKKKYLNLIVVILILANLVLSAPIIFLREHYGAKTQLEKIAKAIKPKNSVKTLFLMSPGWRWQQWAYHLHYFYGLDLLPKLDRFSEKDFQNLMKNYEKIFIIHTDTIDIFPSPFVKQPEPSEKDPFPRPLLYFADENLKLTKEFTIFYPELEITCPLTDYILKGEEEKYDYSRFNEKCFKKVIPSKINHEETKLYFFELIK